MIQIMITPAAGKRLIAKATAELPAVRSALRTGTVVVVAGTTNGYVAQELLAEAGVGSDVFDRSRFFRGITLPPTAARTEQGRISNESSFPGDVVITKGRWDKGKTIFDVVDDLKEGDVVLKGANAVNLSRREAGILIGHPKGGTITSALQAVVGRRVKLILPVGLEKRVDSDINELATLLNEPGTQGPRLMPAPGEIITELDALAVLAGVKTKLVAAGGVCGAEGSVWIAVAGSEEQENNVKALMKSVGAEKPFLL